MAKAIILEWAQHVTSGYSQVNISDFSTSYADGYAFAAIVHYHNPEFLAGQDFDVAMRNMSRLDRLDWAFTHAEDLGIERYLEPEDINEKRPDDKSVLLYMSGVYKHYNGQTSSSRSSSSRRAGGADSIDALIAASEKKRLAANGGGNNNNNSSSPVARVQPKPTNTTSANVARREEPRASPVTPTYSPASSSNSSSSSSSYSSNNVSRPVNSTTSSSSSSSSSSSNVDRSPAVLQNLWKKEDEQVSEVTKDTSKLSISSSSSSSTNSSSGPVRGGAVETNAVPIKVEPGRRRRRIADSSNPTPVDTTYCEVIPSLFLGDDIVSHNLDKLLAIGITHIICLSESQYYNADPFKSNFTYKVLSVQDTTKFEVYDLFDPIADYIASVRKQRSNNYKVLLHCKNGTSLSPTVMIAYLMREHNMKLSTAMNRVKTKWPKTKPNSGFMEQLEDFDLDMDDDAADAGIERI